MDNEDIKRKLSAIFSADAVGYSRLMGEDEPATITTLNLYKETMGKLIQQHRGRVVDSTGDNLLAEFTSVVDAVQCAVEVQQVLRSKNEDLPEDRRMYFRIGINLGDVIEEGDRIYGDGVNIAARVESLADGGGISLSGTAYDQLGKKLPLGYEYLGEQSVKNIEKPVRVYRVLTEAEEAGKVIGEIRPRARQLRWAAIGGVVVLILAAGALTIWSLYIKPDIEPASEDKMAFPLPDKPSIAVLPFTNISGDQSDEYIADGLTENVISSLSKILDLLVIARNSTLVYKGKPVKVNQVAEELGVKYVLEGSIQKSGENLRVTAQLVNALEGHYLWSERYDRTMKDFFKVQDDITRNIVIALQVALTEGEQARIEHTTENLDAWGLVTRGKTLFQHYTPEKNVKSRELFTQAVELDPKYTAAWVYLAWTHLMDARYGYTDSFVESLKKGIEIVQNAPFLDDTQPEVHSFWSTVYYFQRKFDEAISEGEHAIALGPSDATSHILQAMTLLSAGKFEESIFHTKNAMRLDPYYPTWYLITLGLAYCMAGESEKAIPIAKKGLERAEAEGSQIAPFYGILIHSSVDLGKLDEAKAQTDTFLKIYPEWSLQNTRKMHFFKNPEDLERHLSALRKAGTPDNPPLPLPDKPSIAVLPFVNMSSDPNQDYISDGITEQIITYLSMNPDLFVIASHSVFTYKGKPVKVQVVAKELGVKYILEGSVQSAGDRIRVTAQLIDALTGKHLWADRYDRDLKDIFAIQDEITVNIFNELQVKLKGWEKWQAIAGPKSLDFLKKTSEAFSYFRSPSPKNIEQARKLYEEAITLEPDVPMTYTFLGWTHFFTLIYGLSRSPVKDFQRAFELAQKTIELTNDSIGDPHALMSALYSLKQEYEKAVEEAEKAVTISPNNSDARRQLSFVYNYVGRREEAVKAAQQAIRLNPHPAEVNFHALGLAHLMAEQYEEAIEAFKKALHLNPKYNHSTWGLAMVYALLGREKEAKATVEQFLTSGPNISTKRMKMTVAVAWKNQADREFLADAMRKAGFPE